jgi:hypothetical protein
LKTSVGLVSALEDRHDQLLRILSEILRPVSDMTPLRAMATLVAILALGAVAGSL